MSYTLHAWVKIFFLRILKQFWKCKSVLYVTILNFMLSAFNIPKLIYKYKVSIVNVHLVTNKNVWISNDSIFILQLIFKHGQLSWITFNFNNNLWKCNDKSFDFIFNSRKKMYNVLSPKHFFFLRNVLENLREKMLLDLVFTSRSY